MFIRKKELKRQLEELKEKHETLKELYETVDSRNTCLQIENHRKTEEIKKLDNHIDILRHKINELEKIAESRNVKKTIYIEEKHVNPIILQSVVKTKVGDNYSEAEVIHLMAKEIAESIETLNLISFEKEINPADGENNYYGRIKVYK